MELATHSLRILDSRVVYHKAEKEVSIQTMIETNEYILHTLLHEYSKSYDLGANLGY